MIKKKQNNNKLGTPSNKKRNPFLKPDGSFDLIEEFPVYKDKKKRKAER